MLNFVYVPIETVWQRWNKISSGEPTLDWDDASKDVNRNAVINWKAVAARKRKKTDCIVTRTGKLPQLDG